MTIPPQDELKASIAKKSGISVDQVNEVLAGQGVSLIPVAPVKRSIDVRRISFDGRRENTDWDGPFSESFDFPYGVTAFITDKNLRGKSTVLELVTWALRGKPRDLRADVQTWLSRIVLEYAINGVPMAVILTRQGASFVADIVRATDADTLRSYVNGEVDIQGINVVATSLSESQFASVQDETMMALLGFDPITNFQKHAGSNQGATRTNTWPAYYGGIHLPRSSDILFGDTVFAGLPARILHMYCNVPLMGTYIRLATLVRVQKQNEANIMRRINEDLNARAEERYTIESELKDLAAQLDSLPAASGRSFDIVSGELRDAEEELETVIAEAREMARFLNEARAARQQEELRVNNNRENEIAELLFQGLNPAHCPRCEQKIGTQRTEREISDHECAVCTKEIPLDPPNHDEATEGEEVEETEGVKDALEALRKAENAAKKSTSEVQDLVESVRARVNSLASELTASSQADEFTDRIKIQLKQSRLQGRLEGFAEDTGFEESSLTLRVLESTLDIVKRVTSQAATGLFAELDAEILTLGRKLGINNLDAVELNRNGGMKVITAGTPAAFKDLSGGERVRLRVAVIMALLRVGQRSGVGSHPGLVLLDSPGDELTREAEALLLRELDSLKNELPSLQVIVASDDPAAVQGHIPDSQIYSSLDGTPLW